jgi:polyhydroxyalkanoate synthase
MQDASFSATTLAEQLDPLFHAALGRHLASISHAGLLQAGSDWALHLAMSPGKCLDLVRLALHQNP